MSSVIRDFSIDTTEKIKSMIRENVDEESQFGLFDWFEDTFVTKELDIGDYLDDVTEYQKKMIDKHNISGKKFDKIIERVYAVDTNYASRMVLLNERMEAFQTHIYQIMQMQKPEALLLDSDTYQNTTENIKLIYSKAVNGKYNSGISELEHELPALRDVAWYEKAYNVVVGFTEGTIVNTLEGVLYLPLSAIDAIAHTHSIDGLENTEDQINQYFIDNFVTDEESYYIGKITADVTDTAIGIIMGIAGIKSIIGSVTLLTTGTAVSSTGVGIAVGASGMALSIPLALAGAGELILGGSLVYCSMSNLDEDSNSASSAKKPEIDAEKQNAEVEKIKDTIEKTSEGGSGSLSNVEARKWYLEHEAKIPDMIDSSLPLEEQAKQAFNLRNQFRTEARELMADRKTAESLYITDPNKTWEEMLKRQIDKGLTGDDIYKEIIESSQRSRKSVNKSLGLE